MPRIITISPVEIAHLDLAYAHTRIEHSRQVVALADSLLRCGQIVPIVVVAQKPPGFVLIDGYRRVAAARRVNSVFGKWCDGSHATRCLIRVICETCAAGICGRGTKTACFVDDETVIIVSGA